MPALAARPNLRKTIRSYPLADAAAFLEGAAVLLTAGEVDEAGADPAAILGFALHDAGADPDPGEILVALALEGATFVLQGTSAPVAADEGVEYGLVKDGDGIWVVDKTETVNTRVFVEKVFEDREEFEVRVLAANRQLSG
jgi:hypothetical protein